MKKSKKVRLSVDMSERMMASLEYISEELGISKSEAIKRAIVLIEKSCEAAKKGHHIGITSHQENLDTEFIGIVS